MNSQIWLIRAYEYIAVRTDILALCSRDGWKTEDFSRIPNEKYISGVSFLCPLNRRNRRFAPGNPIAVTSNKKTWRTSKKSVKIFENRERNVSCSGCREHQRSEQGQAMRKKLKISIPCYEWPNKGGNSVRLLFFCTIQLRLAAPTLLSRHDRYYHGDKTQRETLFGDVFHTSRRWRLATRRI